MKPSLYLIFFGAWMLSPAWAQIGEDFESPAYTDASAIDLYTGWAMSVSGAGAISSHQASEGSQALVLAPLSPLATATRTVQAGEWSGGTVAYTDFWVLPVADDAVTPISTVELDGVRLAFIKIDIGGGVYKGEVLAIDGAATPPEVETGVYFDLTAQDEATTWLRMTVRQDYTASAQIYDLYINGDLVAANLGFDAASTITAPATLHFTGDADQSVYLDALSLGTSHPLYEDADLDGIADYIENALGLNPSLNDRDLDLDNDGNLNIAEIVTGTPPQYDGTYAAHSSANQSLLYVDGAKGNDANNGLAPYDTGFDAPKASVSNAISSSLTGGTVTALPGTVYNEGMLDLSGKDLIFKPAGDVRIK